MIDPITAGYVANLGSSLTTGVLNMLGRGLQEFIKGNPREQALTRCYQAATAVFLPENDLAREAYHPILQDFLARPAVQAEMAKLITGRVPDQEILVAFFNEAKYYVADLPAYDFPTRLTTAIQAFLERVEQEPALADTIQTAQLRDIVAILREGLGPDVNVMRQILQRRTESPSLGLVLYWESGGGYVPVRAGEKLSLKPVLRGIRPAARYECLFGLGIANSGKGIGRNISLRFAINGAAPCRIFTSQKFVPTQPRELRNWEENYVGLNWQLGHDFVCHPDSLELVAYLILIVPYSETGSETEMRSVPFNYTILAENMEPIEGHLDAEIVWT